MSHRNGAIIAFFGTLMGCAAARAGTPLERADDPAPRSSVLLFRSGRVVEGQITETETHYVVVRPIGKVEVAKTDIELVAKDLEEVYRYRLGRINDRDPEEHLRLAQWCQLVHLRDHAIQQVERTAELTGHPENVRGMLEYLKRMPASGGKTASPPASEDISQSRAAPLVPTHRPLQKEIPPPLVTSFTIHIQPLLTRSCGTAGCHDSSHSGQLVLERSGRPTQRTTQQNLRSALALIDPDDPDQSPLLTWSLRPHAAASRPPLGLGRNDPAYATLFDWVWSVTGKTPSTLTNDQPTPDQPATNVQAGANARPLANGSDPNANTVYSRRPLTMTPSRIRAGMNVLPPPSAIPAGTPAESTAATKPKPTSPNEPENKSAGTVARSAAASGKEPGTQPPRQSTPPIEPSAPSRMIEKPVADGYPGVDPFDPEIFNRQFAPRAAGQRP